MGHGDGGYSDSSSDERERHRHHHHHHHREHRHREEMKEERYHDRGGRKHSDSDSDSGGGRQHRQRERGDAKYAAREYDDDWVYGTFDCFEDPKTCLCGCFCVPCQVRSTAGKLGEPACLYWLMYCFVPCIALSLLRNKTRQKYGIEGDTCEDAVLSWACMHCTNTQLANEINYREA